MHGLDIPDGHHVVVHLLQLLLRRVECVGRRVELVGFEALIGEPDLEGLIVFLQGTGPSAKVVRRAIEAVELASGTSSLSAWDEAASVVTARLRAGAQALRCSGVAKLFLNVLASIVWGGGRASYEDGWVTMSDELSQGFRRVLRLVGSDGTRQKRPMSVRVGLTLDSRFQHLRAQSKHHLKELHRVEFVCILVVVSQDNMRCARRCLGLLRRCDSKQYFNPRNPSRSLPHPQGPTRRCRVRTSSSPPRAPRA